MCFIGEKYDVLILKIFVANRVLARRVHARMKSLDGGEVDIDVILIATLKVFYFSNQDIFLSELNIVGEEVFL